MSKYLLLWKMSSASVPTDAKERGAGWSILIEAVKKDLEDGGFTDWGVFAGEGRGYAIFEGQAEALHMIIQKYVPYVIFRTHPVLGADAAHEVIKKLV